MTIYSQIYPPANYEAYGQMHPLQSMRESQYLREMQYQLQQEALRNYMASGPPLFFTPPRPARTEMSNWTNTLNEEKHSNSKAINELEKALQQVTPVPREDLQLMKIELQLRKALLEVINQRLTTEAANQTRY